ncbi:MAG: BON domain-containing protein [Sulfurifustaceae bacterium]
MSTTTGGGTVMGDKDSRRFGFGDRRHVERGENASTDARGPPSEFRSGTGAHGGHGYGGLGRNVDTSEVEQFLGRIHRALHRDPRIPEEGIHVAVEAGRVTLTGSVRSDGAKRAATEAVQALPGVREVINDIQIIA